MKSSVKIEQIIIETRDAFTLILEKNSLIETYEPGQFINVFSEINGEEVSRPYSFSSSPFLNEFPAITIKRMPQGLMSNYLAENLAVGDQLDISLPNGRFTTTYRASKRHLFMIAGGSGITPIFSILKNVLHEEPASRVTLYYANKDSESVIFKDQLNELLKLYPNRFTIMHFLEAGDQANILEEKLVFGRISEYALAGFLANYVKTKEHLQVFVCGPDGLMSFSIAALLRLGIEKSQIQTEYFGLNREEGEERLQGSSTTAETAQVEVRSFNDNTLHFAVSKDHPVLQSALDQRYKLPHSCQEAMCGTCKVKLVEGEIEMKKNFALPDDELERGYVLLCVGYPQSDKVVLTY
ncbi:MAG: ferredoxin--NADP reductase [Cyclobacteriaceae bacterium]